MTLDPCAQHIRKVHFALARAPMDHPLQRDMKVVYLSAARGQLASIRARTPEEQAAVTQRCATLFQRLETRLETPVAREFCRLGSVMLQAECAPVPSSAESEQDHRAQVEIVHAEFTKAYQQFLQALQAQALEVQLRLSIPEASAQPMHMILDPTARHIQKVNLVLAKTPQDRPIERDAKKVYFHAARAQLASMRAFTPQQKTRVARCCAAVFQQLATRLETPVAREFCRLGSEMLQAEYPAPPLSAEDAEDSLSQVEATHTQLIKARQQFSQELQVQSQIVRT